MRKEVKRNKYGIFQDYRLISSSTRELDLLIAALEVRKEMEERTMEVDKMMGWDIKQGMEDLDLVKKMLKELNELR